MNAKTTIGSMMAVAISCAGLAGAQPAEFAPRIADVTVFKDGHALVMSRASATFQDGWARTRDVPAPILGAFWTFIAEDDAVVDFVSAAQVETQEQRPVLSFDEIIQANRGKRTTITERFGEGDASSHEGLLLGILQHQSSEEVEIEERRPPEYDRWGRYVAEERVGRTRDETTEKMASFVMLQTDDGVRLIKRDNIQGLVFAERNPSTTHTVTREVREISIHAAAAGKPIEGRHEMGMVYLQRGIRWIPDYRIELMENGRAKISLQGTLVNELADLENVNLRLVVGVPSFIMKDDLSPVALRDVGLQLGRYFAPPRQSGGRSQMDYLSNALMTQAAVPVAAREQAGDGGPAVPDEGQREDLYLYHKSGITLKKGARAVVQLFEIVVPYEDVYRWNIPAVPPLEMWRHVNQNQQQELIRSLTGAKAEHQIHMKNIGKEPWTLGPATIFKAGAVLGQHILPYTSVNNTADVTVTVATDLNTKKEETETARAHNVSINNDAFTKVSLHGRLTVTSFKDKPVRLCVARKVVGTATTATHGGEVVVGNITEDAPLGLDEYYWRWWAWPYWWYGVNPMSEIRWEIELPAGKSVALEYDYSYYSKP